mmetsp:Transcript_29806/g.77264  ORF Transcript_29806/g.77264 Transcript_29806/m.77264 type:complete len:304 (-) Transcript_29806:12-923(-)
MDSVDEESFNYRDGDIQYSGDGEDDFHGAGTARMVQNQPHDEEVALSDTADSFSGRDEPPKVADASLIESLDDDGPAMPTTASTFANQYGLEAKPGKLSEVDRSSEAPNSPGYDAGQGLYNAMDFRHLNVSDDVRSVFELIGKYKPHDIELDTKLKPFIPDYIPSIGGIDEFIKVPRPDGKEDFLGLKVLDEPAARQSDPTVLTLQLRQLTKEAPGNQAHMIGRIEHSDEQKRKKIDGWVASVNAIHKEKPPATVSYLRKMPDIETLMQVGKGQKKGKEIRWDLCHADDLHHSPPMQKLTYVD